MKETGIVRRIDELGRVVIPKEIRKTLRIKEGDPLEIYTDKEELLFKKYSPVAKIENISDDIAESLRFVNERTAIICDREKIVSAKGNKSKDLVGKTISEKLENLIKERKCFVANVTEKTSPIPLANDDDGVYASMVVVPIVSAGDSLGAVILCGNEEHIMGNAEIKSVRVMAEFIGKFLA